jgi:phage gpG-like protein
MADDDVKLDTKVMDNLIVALKDNMHRVRVGVLGAKAMRGSGKVGQSNATIGAIHEFGGGKMPMRSFLRVPIAENLDKKIESSGALDKEALDQVAKQKTMLPWLKKLGKLAEQIVLEAFDTGGDGKWPAWKTPSYKNEGGKILQDTGQLRDSISSDVK